MKSVAAVLFGLVLSSSLAAAQTPDAAAGKTLWLGEQIQCRNCHGKEGEGAFGPVLAGRGLTPAQIRVAVRTPSGIMPSFNAVQLSEADIANLAAWFASLPSHDAPGPWATTASADMPEAQRLLVTIGCAQCHGPVLHGPRGTLAGMNADFTLFKNLVYDHFKTYPLVYAAMRAGDPPAPPPPVLRMHVMGNYNPTRLPESDLRKIYDWVKGDLGFLPPVSAHLASSGGAAYTLTLFNGGMRGRGLAAEALTVDLVLPAGDTVAAATGDGYRGVHRDAQIGADIAEWQLPRLAAKETKTLTFTLSKPDATLKGTLRWARPSPKNPADRETVQIAL